MSILSAVQLVSEKMGVTVKANNLTDHDCAFKIEDPKNQKIKVITVVGNQSKTKAFDLTGIEFVPADEG